MADNKWMWVGAGGLTLIGIYMYTRRGPSSTTTQVTGSTTVTETEGEPDLFWNPLSGPSRVSTSTAPAPTPISTTVTTTDPAGNKTVVAPATPDSTTTSPSAPQPAKPAFTYVVKDLDLSAPMATAGIATLSPSKPTTTGYLTYEQAAAVKPATYYYWEKLTQAPVGQFPTGCSPIGSAGSISWNGQQYPYQDCIPTYVTYGASANAYRAYAAATPGAIQHGSSEAALPKAKGNQVVLIV